MLRKFWLTVHSKKKQVPTAWSVHCRRKTGWAMRSSDLPRHKQFRQNYVIYRRWRFLSFMLVLRNSSLELLLTSRLSIFSKWYSSSSGEIPEVFCPRAPSSGACFVVFVFVVPAFRLFGAQVLLFRFRFRFFPCASEQAIFCFDSLFLREFKAL